MIYGSVFFYGVINRKQIKMAWFVVLNPYRKSIKDIIRNPKGVLQAISNKMAIVDNDLESLVLDD